MALKHHLGLHEVSLETAEAAVLRVVALGRELLEKEPSQVMMMLERQARQLITQQREIQECHRQLTKLQDDLEELKSQPRSTAPFRINEDKRQKTPKRPGQKPGHRGQWRIAPAVGQSDEQIEVKLEDCPDCGNQLDTKTQKVVEQTLIEIPEIKPRIIRLRTYRNYCPHCQYKVASHHPLQVSTATGAAGTHLGPKALGLAAALNKDFGLTMRKSCRVLQHCFGISLSPGGLSQALDRIANRLQPTYEQALETLRTSDVVYTDETGWWVGGPGYSLWVVTNQKTTYYQVVSSRNRATAQAILGEDFRGVLVSDCLSIYDGLTPKQHKCYAHHLKALSNALKSPEGKGSSYLLELRALLHAAMLLKRLLSDLSQQQVQKFRQALETRAEQLLSQPREDLNDPQGKLENKLRQRLAKQRDHLFTFLDYPAVEATNNRAERQLRPAVISRKLSCGNKTEHGANTWAILTSLAATCTQRGNSLSDQVTQVMMYNNTSSDMR